MIPHTAADYNAAMQSLLPPGKARERRRSELGHDLLRGAAEELVRLEAVIPAVLRPAVDSRCPRFSSWHILKYQQLAEEALAAGITEVLPHKIFSIGSHVGDRLCSAG